MKTRVLAVAPVALLGLVIAGFTACGDEDDGGDPFGGGSSGQPGDGAGTGGDGGGDDGETTGGDDGTGGGTGSSGTGGTGSSTSSSSSSSSSGDTGTGGTGTGSSGTGGGATCPPAAGNRPETGMYSCCTEDDNTCSGETNLCSWIQDTGMGFCTKTGCADPAADCDPAPAGSTAVPTCYTVTVNHVDEEACGLDCSGGATCPDGMTCYNLAAGQICF
jgi:hypothetical protein